MIKEEIKNINYDKKELVKFSRVMFGALLIISGLLFYFDKSSYIYFIILSVLFLIIGLSFPSVLKPVYKAWMTLAVILGFIMTRVILSILFYIVITPIGIIGRIFGKKFIEKNYDKNKNSYWNYRTIKTKTKEEYERQF